MRNTLRVVLVLFLAILILSNYNSIRVLRHAIQFLDQQLEEQARQTLQQVASDLNHHDWFADRDVKQTNEFLSFCRKKYGLSGIVLYGSGNSPRALAVADVPPEFSDPKRMLGSKQSLRRDKYLLIESSYHEGMISAPFISIFDARRVFQIERTTKIVSYTNILLMLFLGVIVLYFFESVFRSYQALMQTARSAPVAGLNADTHNEADFLIDTFNGVISRLKVKEQELAKLHQSEKDRADDVQQLNQDLIRSISSGLILIDDRGSIRVFNEAAEKILELERSSVLNQSYEDAFPGADDALRSDIARCFLDRRLLNRAELEIKTGGRPRFVNASIMPIQDRSTHFAGVLCLFSDITDFKRLQQQSAQKEKYASLGEMAGGVAHEVRNSVATVTGYVQMLERKMTQDQTQYIVPIQKELQSLQAVINDFLSFARPVQLEMRPVSLRDLLKDCTEEVRVSAPAELEFIMRGEFRDLSGDEAMLRQVFLNLIRNAAQATDGTGRQGTVTITGCAQEESKMVIVDIQDNGNGITEEDLPRIFTPFFTTKKDGVGLGLAIVQKLVLQHNGSITVQSNHSGSIFRVQLPA